MCSREKLDEAYSAIQRTVKKLEMISSLYADIHFFENRLIAELDKVGAGEVKESAIKQLCSLKVESKKKGSYWTKDEVERVLEKKEGSKRARVSWRSRNAAKAKFYRLRLAKIGKP